jgi:predicted Zn-ribbon and HTH transcriptional regulator
MNVSKMKRITPEKQAEFLGNPNKCPQCGGRIRGVGIFKRPKRRLPAHDGFQLRFEVKCPKCKSQFVEVYKLAGIMAKR